MSRFVRTFVMLLMALAIPVQGMAAVVVPLCPPTQETGLSGAGARHVHEQAAEASHDASGAHELHHAHTAPDAAMAADHHGPAAQTETGHAGHGMLKCCSAACSMVAMASPLLVANFEAHSAAPLHPLAKVYQGVTPDGLDRPPKLLLV